MNGEMRMEVDQIKTDLGKLRTDLAELVSAALDAGRRSVQSVRGEAEQKATETVKSVREYVEQQPGTCMMMAFGAGLVAGLILARK